MLYKTSDNLSGITYCYDEFGNLKERTFLNGEVQHYAYNAKDQLIEATIQKPHQIPKHGNISMMSWADESASG
ncbi:MAG: RHS repeat domain-containing protein [Lonepinella koalarum]|nr:RHS repeat domain-containing protein [Lonepinella koalarum]